ncbi:unnamed protein product [Strongylus vulgaris]|uniref:Uncharacterized protein n=1 Tax=Strongylus vulgaris TaxID=40348 RepID=A0A3P7J9K6_STRVU|nr:unnamed protein product [Strongylus vulgaris]
MADEEPEDEDAFDVKNLMNKFKHIGETSATTAISEEQRAELEAIKSQAAKQAHNIKQRFEQGIDDEADMAEEKRRQMQEEFERLKKEREEAQKRLEEERALELQQQHEIEKEDVAIKADHASKMAAKWEKLQAKEAKKAEKSRMPEKKTTAVGAH